MLDLVQLQQQIQALNKGDETLRREAIRCLKQQEAQDWAGAPPKVVNSLIDSLRQQLPKGQSGEVKPPLVRQEVVTILGNIGPRSEPVIPQLMELLEPGVPDNLREAAAVALGKIGKEARVAVDKLIGVLGPECRVPLAARVARALGEIGCAEQRVRTALVNLWLLPMDDQNSRAQIGIALCKLKIEARGLLPHLTKTLVATQHLGLRKAAAEALGWCSKNDLDAVPALTVALREEDEDLVRLANVGLEQMRLTPEKAIQVCARQLKDSLYAEAALRKSGPVAVPALIEALASDDAVAREKAARTLGSLGEAAAEAVPALTEALEDKHLAVRLAAAKGLWNVTKNADLVVPVLAELLKGKWSSTSSAPDAAEERRRFVQSVIESLCRIGAPAKAAVPVLNQKAKDDNRLIRESAQRALREIAPKPLNKSGVR
jgi:HEAT repeat protein